MKTEQHADGDAKPYAIKRLPTHGVEIHMSDMRTMKGVEVLSITVTSISRTWPCLSVSCGLRVTWPQPSYVAVASRSVASTIPVALAAKTPARAKARMVPLNQASR